MKAYLFNGPGEMIFKEVRDPRIVSSSDAIIKVSYSSICGMDLKIKKGVLPEVCPGTILGHEFCGMIVETGSSVKRFKTGDRVAVSSISSCGYCDHCKNGKNEKCINGGWLLGYSIDGCQAQFVRVPFADTSLTLIQQEMTIKEAVFAGDIGVSGYQAALNGNIKPGSSVVVTGSGPAASIAMMCARAFSPSIIIAVDNVPKRLDNLLNSGIADEVVNISDKDAFAKIEHVLKGEKADVVIEATGINEFFSTAVALSKNDGNISVLSVYSKPLIFSMDEIKNRRLTLNTKRIGKGAVSKVLELIADRTINTAFLSSGSGKFDELEKGYRLSMMKEEGFLKWVCCHEV